jgi:hypothetical protein
MSSNKERVTTQNSKRKVQRVLGHTVRILSNPYYSKLAQKSRRLVAHFWVSLAQKSKYPAAINLWKIVTTDRHDF